MTVRAEQLLTVEDLATMLRVEPSTVRQWARDGRLPEPMRLTERSLRWSPAAVNAWLAGHGVPMAGGGGYPGSAGMSEL